MLPLLVAGAALIGADPAGAQVRVQSRGLQRLAADHRLIPGEAANGRILALVVGIDDYQHFPHLNGAVADARDIERSLRRGGVTEITTLTDGAATRSAVADGIERIARDARPGDLVVISYAGHGSQVPAAVPTKDNGGTEEFFALAGFGSDGDEPNERIFDKEIFAWLAKLEAKGAAVIFVADSCHGGGMSKTVDPRIGNLTYRALRYVGTKAEASASAGTYYLARDRLASLPAAGETTAADSLEHLTFIAAVNKWTEAPEIFVSDATTPRGAVSYAFARALEGQADADHDGRITRRELIAFIREKTRALTERGQDPVFEPHDGRRFDDVVLNLRDAGPALQEVAAKTEDGAGGAQEGGPIRVGVVHGAAAGVGAPAGGTPFVLLPADGKTDAFDAVWDAANGDVVSSLGDIVARRVAPDQLSGVVDRLDAVRRLALLAKSGTAHPSLVPGKHTYRAKETAHLQIEGVDGRYLVVANISGNGKIQFVYPIQGDDPMVLLPRAGAAKAIGDIYIKPPFGGEVIVAVASRERLAALEEFLVRRDDQQGAREFVDLLSKLPPETADIGLYSFFTEP